MFRKVNIAVVVSMVPPLLISVLYLRKYFINHELSHLIVAILSIALVSFLGLSLRKSAAFKTKLVTISIGTLFSIYVVELLLNFFPSVIGDTAATIQEMRAAIATQMGVPFDKREKLEVVTDLRKNGDRWYPGVPTVDTSSGAMSLRVNGNSILPLGMVGEANIVLCNESGYWATFASDEYGYNNPFGIWQDRSKIDTVFVGDSFVVGHCVKSGESFVDRMRARFPRTINLGADGSGPLVQLARIKEYLTGRNIDHVFWVYYEGNDLRDLTDREIPELILIKYLTDDFSQNIISNQEAINSALTSFIDNEMQEIMSSQEEKPRKLGAVLSHISLTNVRLLLFQFKKMYFQPDIQYDLNIFREVISKAKSAVERSGGKLVFIYLPDYYRYGNIRKLLPSSRMRDDVLRLIDSLDIDIIDIDLVFRRQGDPTMLFPFGAWGHYNARGHSIVADEILRYLNQNK